MYANSEHLNSIANNGENNMGLKDGKCDSCEKETNFLFPIAVTEELPSGGFAMVTKYYCIECYETIQDAAHDELEEEEEEEKEDEEELLSNNGFNTKWTFNLHW